MGNTASSQTASGPGSIESKSSRRRRREQVAASNNRLSQTVSFYQTPPGSFIVDDDPPLSSVPSDITDQTATPTQSEFGQDRPKSTVLPPPERKWKAGVYSLVNVQTSAALDLSGADDTSLIGFPTHNGFNQQWMFESLGEGYSIRSVSTGKYITLEEGIADGATLHASPFPVSWKVKIKSEGEELIIQILWPTERYAMAIAAGAGEPGCKIVLNTAAGDTDRQFWRLTEHELPAGHPMLREHGVTIRKRESVVESSPSEIVVVKEDQDSVITTRTTTTSTITTVTLVTKSPIRHSAA